MPPIVAGNTLSELSRASMAADALDREQFWRGLEAVERGQERAQRGLGLEYQREAAMMPYYRAPVSALVQADISRRGQDIGRELGLKPYETMTKAEEANLKSLEEGRKEEFRLRQLGLENQANAIKRQNDLLEYQLDIGREATLYPYTMGPTPAQRTAFDIQREQIRAATIPSILQSIYGGVSPEQQMLGVEQQNVRSKAAATINDAIRTRTTELWKKNRPADVSSEDELRRRISNEYYVGAVREHGLQRDPLGFYYAPPIATQNTRPDIRQVRRLIDELSPAPFGLSGDIISGGAPSLAEPSFYPQAPSFYEGGANVRGFEPPVSPMARDPFTGRYLPIRRY